MHDHLTRSTLRGGWRILEGSDIDDIVDTSINIMNVALPRVTVRNVADTLVMFMAS